MTAHYELASRTRKSIPFDFAGPHKYSCCLQHFRGHNTAHRNDRATPLFAPFAHTSWKDPASAGTAHNPHPPPATTAAGPHRPQPALLAAANRQICGRHNRRHAPSPSPAFRAIAKSDAVWACFLPPLADLPPLANGEPLPGRGKKDMFLCLSGSSILLSGGLMSMWLDRDSGAKCYMVSAKQLSIARHDTPQYWSWIDLADSRFSKGAQLIFVCWMEIRGKIHGKMLSQGTPYATYMLFKLADETYGLDSPADASVSVGGTGIARKLCIQHNPQRCYTEDVVLPRERADGWMELELGEFVCEGDEDGDVSFSLVETKRLNEKSGLFMQGMKIRRKNQTDLIKGGASGIKPNASTV
ncbi:F-box protein PP2-B10-like [Triticum dicoccoides]|uniref:F-box protein PP2-B10-like n=1 Tax=Triticum dicoccoides TaxID=85692 RepID=UPI00188E4740|nr:F-box protein PP2-B10-like [Triticum dicoccoides]